MSDPIGRFQIGDTRQFIATYSASPTTPNFAIYAGSGAGSLVYSVTAVASSATVFFANYTFPSTTQLYTYQWTASFQAGAIIFRGYAQAIRYIPG